MHPEIDLSSLEYTVHARRSVEKTTQDPYFRDDDPEMILNALLKEIRSVSFGDYLKRAVRHRAAAEGVTDTDDLDYLCAAFKKRGVPPSFTPTTAKLRALIKGWLTQRAVSRNVVLLLGFALDMGPEEVNEFLTKALREPKLDPKDPFEVVCWYCYRYHQPYSKFEALWAAASGEDNGEGMNALLLDSTVRVRSSMESILSEAQLMAYLMRIGQGRAHVRQSIAARGQFDALYGRARQLIADMKTEMARDDAALAAERLAEKVSRSDKLYDFEKLDRVKKERAGYHTYTAEEIMPVDIENMLYSAIPKDKNGNLIPMKESLLNLPFSGKRLNRQHIQEILEGKAAINRYDIITLCFFVCAADPEQSEEPRERYDAFIDLTNQRLKDSDMAALYVANPYESFVMMCIFSADPLGSFADVWELSYEEE